ncbi:MAG: D-cysteine desulfhydrase family protein [Candidatus Sumerlaeaceae bacterium]|nr:D-cysteine desulfhydrase family protein [Candidatus Sumerlaeaceae bacterium]
MRYPKRLRLAQLPTPIEQALRASATLGVNLFIKRDDLTGSVLSGNKVRKLEFALAEAVRQKADVVITAGGIQSNHCRATAIACARLGLECHLILRGAPPSAPQGNLLLDLMAGARLSFFPREVYSTKKPEIVGTLIEEYARAGKRAYYIPVGASNAIGSLGYVLAFEEICRQTERLNINVRHIVTAVGSGGTLAGLLAGKLLSKRRRPEIWGINVCDDAPTFVLEVKRILEEMNDRFSTRFQTEKISVNVLDGYVGKGYAIPYHEEMDAIMQLAQTEGIVLDPVYTGKAFYGLTREITAGRFGRNDTVLFLHTGGVFGLMAQGPFFSSYWKKCVKMRY